MIEILAFLKKSLGISEICDNRIPYFFNKKCFYRTDNILYLKNSTELHKTISWSWKYSLRSLLFNKKSIFMILAVSYISRTQTELYQIINCFWKYYSRSLFSNKNCAFTKLTTFYISKTKQNFLKPLTISESRLK